MAAFPAQARRISREADNSRDEVHQGREWLEGYPRRLKSAIFRRRNQSLRATAEPPPSKKRKQPLEKQRKKKKKRERKENSPPTKPPKPLAPKTTPPRFHLRRSPSSFRPEGFEVHLVRQALVEPEAPPRAVHARGLALHAQRGTCAARDARGAGRERRRRKRNLKRMIKTKKKKVPPGHTKAPQPNAKQLVAGETNSVQDSRCRPTSLK